MSYFNNDPRYVAYDWKLTNKEFFIGFGNDEGFYRMRTSLHNRRTGSTENAYIITNSPTPSVKISGYNSDDEMVDGNVATMHNFSMINTYSAYNYFDLNLYVKDGIKYFTDVPVGLTPNKYEGVLSGYSDMFYSSTLNYSDFTINYDYDLTSGGLACEYAYVKLNYYFDTIYKCENSNGLGKYINIDDDDDFRYFGEQFYEDGDGNVWHKTTSNALDPANFPNGTFKEDEDFLLTDTPILSSSVGVMVKRGKQWFYYQNIPRNFYWTPGFGVEITPDTSPITFKFYENGTQKDTYDDIILRFKQWKDFGYGTSNNVYYTIPNIW